MMHFKLGRLICSKPAKASGACVEIITSWKGNLLARSTVLLKVVVICRRAAGQTKVKSLCKTTYPK